MKVIIPMAGMGKRMRPHTLTIPKPLIRIAGKPIVQRLVEEIARVSSEKIDEIAFIIGDFGKEVEKTLAGIADEVGARASIYYQEEALGTAHAILCAADSMEGPVTIAFADTLFHADFKLDTSKDSIIWVKQVDNPSAFGVVKLDKNGLISDFVEKPKEFVSDLAIIGIYYFRDGNNLKNELQFLIDNKVIKGGEYQLTDALQNMLDKGLQFSTGEVGEWLDCGNKNATVYTNNRILELNKGKGLVSDEAVIKNSIIIEPCFIGKGVKLTNSIIGPHVSVGEESDITNSVVSNSIIQTHSKIQNVNMENSMIGNHVEFVENPRDVSMGDFTTLL